MEKERKAKKTEEIVKGKTEPWHKPKNGSVFPAKRCSVKQMMWNRVVESVTPPPKLSQCNKSNSVVHPFSTEPLVDEDK